MSTVTDVWASDTRKVGITLETPFTQDELDEAVERVRAVLAREGGAGNATIRYRLRRDRAGYIDVVAEWDGFIAPAAEKHRVWTDAGS